MSELELQVDAICADQERLTELMTLAKRREGMSAKDLVFIGIANVGVKNKPHLLILGLTQKQEKCNKM